MTLPCFKAYDIRGRVPDELDEHLARRIGAGMAGLLDPGPVVVGYDIRLSSPGLAGAVIEGLTLSRRDVIDIGMCGTEEVYFHTFDRKAAGGIMVTASHNPMDYNGMKLLRAESRPISGDTGLFDIRDFAASGVPLGTGNGTVIRDADKSRYIRHLLDYVDVSRMKPLKIVTNAGNGGAGRVVDALAPHLPIEFVRILHEPDGRFPNGIPNPLLPENRSATSDAVKASGADFGIAWDGDFDRCFFFDAQGRFIEGYYVVGLLAAATLHGRPGGKVIHDPRLTWNTVEIVRQAGGVPVMSKTGHAFIKERMRAEDAIYGGEMSAHHYFREFAYCDSGMIPWLLVAQMVSDSGQSLGELVAERMRRFPCSGEINFRVESAEATLARILAHFEDQPPMLDRTDGVSFEFPQWRFNLRSSNTEPLLRLNVETRGDAAMLHERVRELTDLIGGSRTNH